MTSQQNKEYVYKMLRQRQVGNVSIDFYNQCLALCELNFIKSLVGDISAYENGLIPIGKTGAEETTSVIDAIEPLVKRVSITGSSQLFPKPKDYFYRYNLEYTYNSLPKGIDIIPQAHRDYRLNSGIVAPSAEYPVGFNLGANWEVYPSTITTASLTYVSMPLPPTWQYTLVSGVPTFAASLTPYTIVPTFASGTTTISCTSNTTIQVGDLLTGTGIPALTYINWVNVPGAVTQFTITNATTAGNSGAYTGTAVSRGLSIAPQYHDKVCLDTVTYIAAQMRDQEQMQMVKNL